MGKLKFEVEQSTGIIRGNFEEIKKEIAERMSEYDGAIFTEKSKTLGKVIIADLRKQKKEIDDTRKEVKSMWLMPYNDFETKIKELQQLIDAPIELIDRQIKEMEEQRIEKKKAAIREAYDAMSRQAEFAPPLQRIYDTKWENATVKMPTIENLMAESLSEINADLLSIKNMKSESVPEAVEMYKKDFNLAKAITYINNYETQKIEILRREEAKQREKEEWNRRQEIERVRAEERARIAEEQNIRREAVEELKVIDEVSAAPLITKESLRVIYTVVATKEELEEVETALTSLGIYYERRDV